MFHKRLFVLAVCIGLLILSSLDAQQQNQAPAGRPQPEPVVAKQLHGDLHRVSGGTGNSFFYVGPDEVLLIDAKISGDAAKAMLAEIRKITDKPIRRVVLTHSDGDHVNGLVSLTQPLTIISHANCRQDIARANTSSATKLPLPNEVFSKEMTLFVGNTEFRLMYFGPAHTDGDVVIYIPSEKTVIVGDLVFIGRDPLIHRNKNGSSFGLVSVLKAIAQLDADVVLSGHADGVDKKAIETLITEIEQKQAKVKALVDEGKTLAEVKEAFAAAGQPVAPGGRWPSLVDVIYQELTAKK
jgi:cyclase